MQELNRKQRRALNSKKGPSRETTQKKLSDEAYAIATERMVKTFGNELSETHCEALMRTAGLFSKVAMKQITGRYVADMATGCGKTLSVVSWLTAVHRQNLPLSVTVAASQVEALAKMIRDLVEQGVPREEIGLIHTKTYNSEKATQFLATGDYSILGSKFASESVTEGNDKRRFLFVSHQRIREAAHDTTKEDVFMSYNGGRRNLVIWDEVLLTTAPKAATLADIKSGIGALAPYLGEDTKLNLALRYLKDCERWLDDEYARQGNDEPARAFTPSALGEAEYDAFKAVLSSKLGSEIAPAQALEMLLAASGQELRLARMGDKKSALITYRVIIPASLKNVVILDASHAVNKLVALDSTIERDEWFQFQADKGRHLKTYGDVTVHFAKASSGRVSIEKVFSERAYKADSIPAQIVKAVADIPKDEAVIVFTFKHRGGKSPNIPDIIRSELRRSGIDPEAKTPEDKPRVTILTWGQHTSLNEYAHAQNIIFAGVLHLDDETVLAWAVGQNGDLTVPIGDKFNITEIKRGDIVSSLYQAMSRGSCRFTLNGNAKPMKVWLLHHDPKVKDELEIVMPGVQWADWDIGVVRETGKAETIALQIAAYLRNHSGGLVSNRSIKAVLGLGDTSHATFTRAVGAVSLPGWKRQGRSFVRADTATAYGFMAET